MRKNATGAVNQQERLDYTNQESSETIRQTPNATRQVVRAYLFGAMHDGWIRKSDQRYRIAQKGTEWLEAIQEMLLKLGYQSWIYQEGKTRDVYILESVAAIFREKFHENKIKADDERCAYLRGFFDAEGGIPKSPSDVRYIQLVQKDKLKIIMLKNWLANLNIETGKIHNPSKRVDPNYWRIFISRRSIPDFVSKIGSWHPRKVAIFDEWMKI